MKSSSSKTICVNVKTFGGDQPNVYIGRPSKWGNPFEVGRDGTRKECIDKYREYINGRKDLLQALSELKGKALMCFCKPKPCHGDVLVELVEGDNWKHFFWEKI